MTFYVGFLIAPVCAFATTESRQFPALIFDMSSQRGFFRVDFKTLRTTKFELIDYHETYKQSKMSTKEKQQKKYKIKAKTNVQK